MQSLLAFVLKFHPVQLLLTHSGFLTDDILQSSSMQYVRMYFAIVTITVTSDTTY